MSTTAVKPATTDGVEPLTRRKAWKSLQAHYKKVRTFASAEPL